MEGAIATAVRARAQGQAGMWPAFQEERGGAGEGLEIRLKTSHSPKMRAFRLKMVTHPTGDELAETCTWTASQRRSICGRRREDPLPGAAVPATGTMQSRDQKEGAPQNAYPAKPPSGMQGMVCEPRAKSV